jgi:hypothetical protein
VAVEHVEDVHRERQGRLLEKRNDFLGLPDDVLAAAGLVPEHITARLLRRPPLTGRLVRCADGLDDARLDDLSRKLERDLFA